MGTAVAFFFLFQFFFLPKVAKSLKEHSRVFAFLLIETGMTAQGRMERLVDSGKKETGRVE